MVVITLRADDEYAISLPETIRIELPRSTVKSDDTIEVSALVASPGWARWPLHRVHPIIIDPEVGSASVTTDLSNETDLTDTAPHSILLALEGDTWAEAVGQYQDGVNARIIRGLASDNDDPYGA